MEIFLKKGAAESHLEYDSNRHKGREEDKRAFNITGKGKRTHKGRKR